MGVVIYLQNLELSKGTCGYNVRRFLFYLILIIYLLSGICGWPYANEYHFTLSPHLPAPPEASNTSLCIKVQFSSEICTLEATPVTLLHLYTTNKDGNQSVSSLLLNCTGGFDRAVLFIGSSASTIAIGSIALYSLVPYLLRFTYPAKLILQNTTTATLVQSGLIPCEPTQDTELAICGSFVSCTPSLLEIGIDDAVVIRHRREVVVEDFSNNTNMNPKVAAAAETTTQSSGKLSDGALAAAIVVPIIVLIILAVGGYFLYRWIRSKRSRHGVYNPGDEESRNNPNQLPTDPKILTKPPEEGLI